MKPHSVDVDIYLQLMRLIDRRNTIWYTNLFFVLGALSMFTIGTYLGQPAYIISIGVILICTLAISLKFTQMVILNRKIKTTREKLEISSEKPKRSHQGFLYINRRQYNNHRTLDKRIFSSLKQKHGG